MDPDNAALDGGLSNDSNQPTGTFDAAVEAELAAMRASQGVAPDAKPHQQNAPAQDSAQAEQPDPADQQDATADDAGGDEDANPTVEVEVEGERYAIPEKLRESFMLKADYTRKTQEVAQERNAIAQERLTVRQLFNVAGQFNQADMTVRQISAAIANVERQLTPQLRQVDPVEFSTKVAELQMLERHRNAAFGAAQQMRGEYANYEAQQQRSQVERGHVALKAIMPDITPESARALADYGVRSGLRPETIAELNAGFDPAAVALIDKARRYDELMASNPAVTRKVAQAKPVVRVGAAQGQNRGNTYQRAEQSLRRTGSVNDAVALELAAMQRNQRRR